jgi:hypothetical protein
MVSEQYTYIVKAIFTLRLQTARYSKEIQEKILVFNYELPSRC